MTVSPKDFLIIGFEPSPSPHRQRGLCNKKATNHTLWETNDSYGSLMVDIIWFTKHGDFPVRYVRLLTGNTATHSSPQCFRSNNGGNYSKLRGSLCFGTHFGGKAIKNDEPRVLSDWTGLEETPPSYPHSMDFSNHSPKVPASRRWRFLLTLSQLDAKGAVQYFDLSL